MISRAPFRRQFVNLLVGMLASVSSLDAGAMLPAKFREIGTVELRDRLKRERIVLVDIRSPEDFLTLHMWGAVNIPGDQVEEMWGLIPPDRSVPVVFYGLGEPDSALARAAETASQDLGYEDVAIYRDGFSHWRWRGYFLSGEGLNAYLSRRKDDPRNRTDRPRDVMDVLGIKPGDAVADVGAGYGYFTMHFSHRVGERGHVYAVDIVDAYVEQLKERIRQAGLSNVQIILGDVDNPRLPEGLLEGVLVFDTYHEMGHFHAMLNRIKEALRTGGRLIIVDYEPSETGEPRNLSVDRHTIPADTVIAEVEEVGMKLLERQDEFITGHSRGPMFLLLFGK